MLQHLIERVKLSKFADSIILCTSNAKLDDPLVLIAKKENINIVRGDTKDVLSRFVKAIDKFKLDYIVRVTGDDILIDPHHLDLAIKQHIETNSDYTTCHDLPKGTEGEIISSEAIKKVFFLAEDSSYSEYMTYYFTQNSLFRKSNLEIKKKYQKNWNLTIDYKHQFNKDIIKSTR